MWQANIVIENNTSYNLTIDGVGPGNQTIGPNQQASWSSTEVHNTKPYIVTGKQIGRASCRERV